MLEHYLVMQNFDTIFRNTKKPLRIGLQQP